MPEMALQSVIRWFPAVAGWFLAVVQPGHLIIFFHQEELWFILELSLQTTVSLPAVIFLSRAVGLMAMLFPEIPLILGFITADMPARISCKMERGFLFSAVGQHLILT